MKRKYSTPKAYKLDYEYDEQVVAASSGPSLIGTTGTLFPDYFCQFGVDANGFTSCRHYYTTEDKGTKCDSDAIPMMLF